MFRDPRPAETPPRRRDGRVRRRGRRGVGQQVPAPRAAPPVSPHPRQPLARRIRGRAGRIGRRSRRGPRRVARGGQSFAAQAGFPDVRPIQYYATGSKHVGLPHCPAGTLWAAPGRQMADYRPDVCCRTARKASAIDRAGGMIASHQPGGDWLAAMAARPPVTPNKISCSQECSRCTPAHESRWRKMLLGTVKHRNVATARNRRLS